MISARITDVTYMWYIKYTQNLYLKTVVFWDVAPCSLVETDWSLRGACCLHHRGSEGQNRLAFLIRRAYCENSGSHGGAYDDGCLLGCCVRTGLRVTTACCLRCPGLEAASTSETSVNSYQTTRRYIPEDSHLHTHRRENIKSHRICACLCSFQEHKE
jgi:hypothetical protein